jgi:hypothetical protein
MYNFSSEHHPDLSDEASAMLYHLLPDGYHPMSGSSSRTISDFINHLYLPSDLPVNIIPPAVTAELNFPTASPSIPPVTAAVNNHSNNISYTSTQCTANVHSCARCGKLYHRRALAQGCENRHQNLRPFPCTKRCGDQNWYAT